MAHSWKCDWLCLGWPACASRNLSRGCTCLSVSMPHHSTFLRLSCSPCVVPCPACVLPCTVVLRCPALSCTVLHCPGAVLHCPTLLSCAVVLSGAVDICRGGHGVPHGTDHQPTRGAAAGRTWPDCQQPGVLPECVWPMCAIAAAAGGLKSKELACFNRSNPPFTSRQLRGISC
jgi:hypothetical protein